MVRSLIAREYRATVKFPSVSVKNDAGCSVFVGSVDHFSVKGFGLSQARFVCRAHPNSLGVDGSRTGEESFILKRTQH